MKKSVSVFVVLFLAQILGVAQSIYFKSVSFANLSASTDSAKKINVYNDSVIHPKEVGYALQFFQGTLYKKIVILKGNKNQFIRVKSPFANMFKRPDNRIYKIYVTTNFNNRIDTVNLKYSQYNAKIGQLLRVAAYINDYSTSGFFDLFAFKIKNMSKKRIEKRAKDLDLKVLEVGGGYQLLTLSQVIEKHSVIDQWQDPEAYVKFIKLTHGKYLPPSEIQRYIRDMPIYVTKKFE
jgi:hypothetical protein